MNPRSNSVTWTLADVRVHNDYITVRPQGFDQANLPVLYLLHGQGDVAEDWYAHPRKGLLLNLLNQHLPFPVLVVLPVCGDKSKARSEPPLNDMVTRFDTIRQEVERGGRGAIDGNRSIILGISMGGKQSLAIVLHESTKGKSGKPFQLLGILSGKFQGNNMNELNPILDPAKWRQAVPPVFHYCGSGPGVTVPATADSPERRSVGDEQFYPNNEEVAKRVGAKILSDAKGQHNWNFWRPQLAEFFRRVAGIWGFASS